MIFLRVVLVVNLSVFLIGFRNAEDQLKSIIELKTHLGRNKQVHRNLDLEFSRKRCAEQLNSEELPLHCFRMVQLNLKINGQTNLALEQLDKICRARVREARAVPTEESFAGLEVSNHCKDAIKKREKVLLYKNN